MNRITSGLLCSALLLGLVVNSPILSGYAEEVTETTTSSSTVSESEPSKIEKDSESSMASSEEALTKVEPKGSLPSTSKEDNVPNKQQNSTISESDSENKSTINNSKKLPKSNFAVVKAVDGFTLSDWSYTEANNEIILTQYKGSSKNLTIPGEIYIANVAKHIILQNCNQSLLKDPNRLTIKEVNGKKVGLQATSLWGAFKASDIDYIDLSGLDTSNVTNMAGMFYGSELESIIMTGMNISKVTDMNSMFAYSYLKSFKQDLNTSSVKNMKRMFYHLQSRPTELDVNNFDMSNVDNAEQMFSENPYIKYYNLSKWNLKSDSNILGMFSSAGVGTTYSPLLVVTSDPLLLKQNNEKTALKARKSPTDSTLVVTRSMPGPYFDGGETYSAQTNDPIGMFSDNLRYHYYFSGMFVDSNDPKLNLSKAQSFINAEYQLLPTLVPSASYDFDGYLLDQSGVEPSQANSIADLLNNIYTAQWLNQSINTSPDNQNLTPNSSLLGFAYLPKSFNTGNVNLQNSGQQEIPLQKNESFNIGVKDRTRTNSSWTVTATFNWVSKNKIPNAYIQSGNQSGTIMDNWNDGATAYSSANLRSLTDNSVVKGIPNFQLKVGETKQVMVSNNTAKKNGVYDYNLGEAKLVIPDVSQVETGTYTGTIHWNLSVAPN